MMSGLPCACTGTKAGSGPTTLPVYWGYSVPAHLLHVYAKLLHSSKLLVVFDIDETLLIANTVESLQARLQRVQAAR